MMDALTRCNSHEGNAIYNIISMVQHYVNEYAVIFNFLGVILRSFGHMLAVSIDDFTQIMHQKVTNVGIWYVHMH